MAINITGEMLTDLRFADGQVLNTEKVDEAQNVRIT